jgi:hypothetical protein
LILYVLDLKNLHNKKISQNNLYEILRNFPLFRKISRNKVLQNFAEFREILRNQNHFRRYFVFREIKKILFRDHTTQEVDFLESTLLLRSA